MMTMKRTHTYTNPAAYTDRQHHTNPDPFILRWCGRYYCYATDEKGVKVSVSDDLTLWEDKGYALTEEEYKTYWAPAVFYENGLFYLYYSSIPKEETDCHQEHLKLAVSEHPLHGFVWKKTFFDEFSIDAHPVCWRGKRYLFYSVNNWIGTEEKEAGTCILADQLITPDQLLGKPVEVILPSLGQEIYEANRFGDGRDWYTIEGAAHLVHGNRMWLFYSANAYLNPDYFVGTAAAEGRENLLDMEWKKLPEDRTWKPLLKKNDDTEGTGHNSITKAPNLVDDWIVYHGRDARGIRDPEAEQREMYLDPLYLNGKEILCLGPTFGEQPAPQGPRACGRDIVTEEQTFLWEGNLYYVMEFWVSAKKSHAGARYGIYLWYQDERNYLELGFRSGRKEFEAVECREGIRTILSRRQWQEEYDYTVPHLVRVERRFGRYQVLLDEKEDWSFQGSHAGEIGQIGIKPYFSEVTIHSIALTDSVSLTGKELLELSRFYKVSGGVLDEGGLVPLPGKTLELDKRWEDGKEAFFFEITSAENFLQVWDGETYRMFAENKKREFCLYHEAGGEDWFLTDGEIQIQKLPQKTRICIKGLKIQEYQFTKKEKE